jgi:hypothetical protein
MASRNWWVARNTGLKQIKNIQGRPVSRGAIFSSGPGQSDWKGRSWNGTQLSRHGRNHACNHAGEAHGRIQSSAIVNAPNNSRFKIWVKLEIQRHNSRFREILWSFREKTSFIVHWTRPTLLQCRHCRDSDWLSWDAWLWTWWQEAGAELDRRTQSIIRSQVHRQEQENGNNYTKK